MYGQFDRHGLSHRIWKGEKYMEKYSHRMAEVRIRVMQPDGTPAVRQRIRADQLSHSFLFGCGAFDAVAMMKTKDEKQHELLSDRMEKWLKLFNYGTLPFYWGRYEPEEGKTAYEETMAAAKWLQENGVTVKGHPLCWHTVCAPWLLKYDEILIEGLLAAGVPISAIGIQSHQHQGYWGLEKLNQVLERFSRFGRPIHFTENTLVSGELMPKHIVDLNDWQVESWPSTPEGEDRQAKEIAEMYETLFAHPLVEAITTWDFNDGCWLGAPSGVVRKDNSEKPSYAKLMSLIHGEWETHTQAETDGEGWLTLKGFKGDYQLSGESGSAKVTIGAGSELEIRLMQ